MLAVLLTLAVTVLAAPAPEGAEGKLYFPTNLGAVSVFECVDHYPGTKEERTETVTRVEFEGGVYKVTLKGSYDKSPGGGVVYAVSADGVVTHSGGWLGRNPPVPWLKVNAKPGDMWEGTFDGGTEKITYTHVGEEEVEVPAGKFKAIRVDTLWVTAKFKQVIRTSYWVAPGVGKVKGVSNSGFGPDANNVSELKSFTPGTGEKPGEPGDDAGPAAEGRSPRPAPEAGAMRWIAWVALAAVGVGLPAWLATRWWRCPRCPACGIRQYTHVSSTCRGQ